ncbi:TolC family protein [Aporhodopirellula aestuarii]
MVLLVAAAGCSRTHYRVQADGEANALIAEKATHVARPVNTSLTIDVDPRSRMYNPFDPDFQPMPLDDPASNRYMQCVDGRRGYPMWEAAGLTNTAENPLWWQYLPLNENGILELNADNAVRIALLHSPEYQEQLETLFLSALDVSSERFQFDTQFYGGFDTSYTAVGRRRTGESQSQIAFGADSNGPRDLALQRAFATGGNLIVGVANNIVWELSGPNSQSAFTVLDFTLLQPLLRGAGRDRVLERLTLAERRLLANVRAFERFRREFYLNITTGRSISTRVQRSGGVFGVGLGGFTGLGGGFGGLGGGGGFGLTGGGGVPDAGGFIGLLQDQLQIRNLEENIARLGENLVILENTLVELLTTIPDDPEAIIRQRLQIAQSRSSLLGAQSALVTRRVAFQNSIDSFLSDLGLPPYLCVEINDPALNRFELIDRDLRSRREQLIAARAEVGELNVRLLDLANMEIDPDTGLPRAELAWDNDTITVIEKLRLAIKPLSRFSRSLITEDLPRVQKDLEILRAQIPERRQQTQSLLALYREEQDTICSLLGIETLDESIFDIQPILELGEELEQQFEELSQRLAGYQSEIDRLTDSIEKFVTAGPGTTVPSEIADKIRQDVILSSQKLLSELGDDVLALQLVQARARVESLVLPEVEIDPAQALQIARVNRRDWANARASLVDRYRSIEFIADNLESSLDLTFSGDIQNNGNNPFALRQSNSSLRVGLQWDAPITRLQERNTYRQALIEYEQAKRSYYGYEDGIWQLLRATIRQLQANRINFELGRQSVRIAATQLELNEDIRSFRDARGLNSGPTAARDTISALSDLLNSQNGLLNLYVNFEVVRRGLDLDLGTMELTPDGMWIDPGPLDPDNLLGLVGTSEGGLIDCGHFIDGENPCTPAKCGLQLKTQPTEAIYNSAMYSDGL